MVTFLDDGSIIAKYNNRFIKFSSTGSHQDEIEFEGSLTKYLGEREYRNADRLHYDVYWHEFLFQNDEGINRECFCGPDGEK